jgi:hypothetical protein
MSTRGSPHPVAERPFGILVRKAGGEAEALELLGDASSQMGIVLQPGLQGFRPDQVLAGLALMKLGMSPESVGALLTWQEFEGFCADVLGAHGYGVKANIVMTKPRRQIDIFAEGPTLALSVDCKHWGRPFSAATLERVASSQIERTTLYKKRRSVRLPVLPVILTLLDPPLREVMGVPVVPVFALRDFLVSVNRFDEGLAII